MMDEIMLLDKMIQSEKAFAADVERELEQARIKRYPRYAVKCLDELLTSSDRALLEMYMRRSRLYFEQM